MYTFRAFCFFRIINSKKFRAFQLVVINIDIFFLFSDCQTFFLRHTDSGKCITRTEELVCTNLSYAFAYFVAMTDNCLNVSAQFNYLDTGLLQNIDEEGTLVSPSDEIYKNRFAVLKDVQDAALKFQSKHEYSLKQTKGGSLSFYKMNASGCADPTPAYVLKNTTCDTKRQNFTFGMWYQ